MESVIGRYRNLIILVGVLFLQVLGLAMQVKRSGADEEKTRLIRIWAVDAITPFERVLIWAQNGGGNLWRNYFYLRGVRAENRQLKDEIEHMRLQQVRLAEDAAQARRLQVLLAFKEQFISRTLAAQVIGTSGSDHSRIIYIDKGENVGIKRDMAVMTAEGIVGKVLLVFPSVAQVLLISDESSGVGALTENGRVQGVLRGTSNGEVVLEKVMADEQIPVGAAMLTSGGDQIFPPGLPVGTVTSVGKGRDLFLSIKIKPAADLSKLEEVLVLVEKQERQPTAEDVRMRAADILAQRLPSVPDKPATDAKAAPGTAETVGKSAAAKAATPNPATKPTGTANNLTKPLSTAIQVLSPAAKDASATDSVPRVPAAGQPGKVPDRSPTKPKSDGAVDTTGTATKPEALEPKPAPPQTKPDKPATAPASAAPPQASPQPPADGTSPQ
jgi:rod shape-determining protein MreC